MAAHPLLPSRRILACLAALARDDYGNLIGFENVLDDRRHTVMYCWLRPTRRCCGTDRISELI